MTVDAYYLSPVDDPTAPSPPVPEHQFRLIGNQIGKMKEIYRQLGIRVAWASINSEGVPQSWFDAVAASNEEANQLNDSECTYARNAILKRSVPETHIRIGYVDATLMPLVKYIPKHVLGFAVEDSDGVIVSLVPADIRSLGVSSHEVGHVLGLGHAPNGHWLMDAAMTWTNNKLDDKRFQEADLSEIRKREHYYEYYVPN